MEGQHKEKLREGEKRGGGDGKTVVLFCWILLKNYRKTKILYNFAK